MSLRKASGGRHTGVTRQWRCRRPGAQPHSPRRCPRAGVGLAGGQRLAQRSCRSHPGTPGSRTHCQRTARPSPCGWHSLCRHPEPSWPARPPPPPSSGGQSSVAPGPARRAQGQIVRGCRAGAAAGPPAAHSAYPPTGPAQGWQCQDPVLCPLQTQQWSPLGPLPPTCMRFALNHPCSWLE